NPGVCHACGHDMHTAMLLGAAHVLYALRDELSGSVKLIFQPAEESVLSGGAPDMIADGVLEHPHVDAVIGQHMWPQFPTGTAAIRNGAMMASSDRFFITVKGKSSHGSAPEDGIDAIVIAAQVITALQTIVSRGISPLDSAVVSIGVIHGGDRYNVIANEVKLEGTCRNLNPLVRNQMPKRIEQIIRGVTDAMGGTYDFRYCYGYAPTVNNPKMFELVYGVMKDMLGDNAVIPPSSALGGEDFSFFCEERPSAFFWLGCRRPEVLFGDTFPIHNGGFSPDEKAMPVGIEIFVNSALKFLNE
ncbi:MAG: amidohydrolase, partial [Oscillospiraceae bacterium]